MISLAILNIHDLNYSKIIKKSQSIFETKIYEVLVVKKCNLVLNC